MATQADFINFNLNHFGYSSKEELIENLYIQAIIDSYSRVGKTISNENDIRDRFISDFNTTNSLTKDWIQLKILHVNWERWIFSQGNELGRADLSFEIQGLDFIVECKRLKGADKKYFEEGLMRFINLKYGKGDDYAGMLGFVINGDQDRICNELKKKSKGYSQIDSIFSSKDFSPWNPSFLGTHLKQDQKEINIYHLFFKFDLQILLEKEDLV